MAGLTVFHVPEEPAARGCAVGLAFKSQIKGLWDRWTCGDAATEAKYFAYAARVWPKICEFAPSSALEIDALARASKLPRVLIVALNCYDELGLLPDEATSKRTDPPLPPRESKGHCTGAITTGGVNAQTWDCPLFYRPVVLLASPTAVHLTFPGIIGGPFINGAGLSVSWFSVIPMARPRAGLPNTVLLREAQRRFTCAADALEFWASVPRCRGTCFMTTDSTSTSSDRAARAVHRFEANAAWHVIESRKAPGDAFAHANHYVADDFQEDDALGKTPWTLQRMRRMTQLLAGNADKRREDEEAGGPLADAAVERVKGYLADMVGSEKGESICEHAAYTGGDWETLCCVVFTTAQDGRATAYCKAGRGDDAKTSWFKLVLADQVAAAVAGAPSPSSAPAAAPAETVQVGVVCPLLRDHQQCEHLAVVARALYNLDLRFHFFESKLLFSSRDDDEEFDMCGYVDECVALCKSQDVEVLLATRDMADIVHAALATDRFATVGGRRYTGPSVVAVYSALDKLRARQTLDPNPIAFAVVDVGTSSVPVAGGNGDGKKLLPFYPAFLKPRTASCSQLAGRVISPEEAGDMLESMRLSLPSLTRYLPAFMERYLPPQERAATPDLTTTVLAEEFMDASTFKVTVDGCVRSLPVEKGGATTTEKATRTTTTTTLWGITDSNYCDGHEGQCFDNCSFPSRWCGTPVEATLIGEYNKVVERLVARGFSDQFVDVEFFIRGASDAERALPENVRVMEVNTRMFPQMAPAYRNILVDGDQYKALIEIGRGQAPATPTWNGLVGSNFYVNVFPRKGKGPVHASSVIHFGFAAGLVEHVELKVQPETPIEWSVSTRKCGLCVAMFYVYSRSLEVNQRRAAEIRRGIIRDHELLP